MKRRLSNFPLDKPFRRQAAGSEIENLIFRLVVGYNTERPYVIGTATIVCGHLLVTAKHVIDEMLKREVRLSGNVIQNSLVAVHVVPGPEYRIWHVLKLWACPKTDIALLHLANRPVSSENQPIVDCKQPTVRSFPPKPGDKIVGIGHRKSAITVSRNKDGGIHYDINSELMTSVGIVREIHTAKRDSIFLPFPCYRVSARFDAGMSGGAVFDESGSLCGLICSSVSGSHKQNEPISYVVTLWPMFLTMIDADRGAPDAKGVSYPAFNLARDKIISVVDYDSLAAIQPRL